MPNHIHGIIIIVGNEYFRSYNLNNSDNGILNKNIINEDIEQERKTNLSNVIKGFKIGCTKEIRNLYEDFNFGWQKSFFDVIIRNDEQLEKTREYILNNPSKWEFDVNNNKSDLIAGYSNNDKIY